MKRNGFTLVELLAVIVLLAVILAIAIPSISTTISTSTKSAFEEDAKMILKSIEYKIMENPSLNPNSINESNIDTLLNISNSNYQTVSVSSLKGKTYVVIQGKNKWNGLVVYGMYTGMKVADSSSYTTITNQIGYDTDESVNEPKLAQGMTPIKWNGTKWVDTTVSDTDWYSYDATNKKWANARTADGSMRVWIPRYIYRISTGWHTSTAGTIDVQFSKGVDDNWNSSVIGNIDTDQTSNASNNKWTNHPAFDFGSAKLTGIWVAKFEATKAEGVANGNTADQSCSIVGDNDTTKTIRILPNAISWRCIQIGNAFTVSRNMESNSSYGWSTASGLQANGTYTTDNNNIDTHLIKNVEWGAVAYLSKSNYGQNTNEIWINPANNYTTGCAGTGVSSGATTYTYETTNGVHASTTGTIYGIYDMSGGTPEYTSAYVSNGNGDLLQGTRITGAIAQYKDVYTVGVPDDQPSNYALAINLKGDAIYETSNNSNGTNSWFGDSSIMPSTINPWFLFGGRYSYGAGAGSFSFTTYWGGAGSSYGFRPVLVVNTGL